MSDTFTLRSDDLRATVSTYGARLETLSYRGGPSLVLHSDRPGWHDVYPGAIVGPVANRVRGGHVAIDGTPHQMPCNENGITALHSGPTGLDRTTWQLVDQSAQQVHMRCTLGDGDGGLPGTRTIDVTYGLSAGSLTLTITATTDAPTPINIAHHPYWRLGAAADHLLQVHADRYLPVDASNVPTGVIADVTGTPFDHRQPKPLDAQIDHNLCISDRAHDTPRPIARLTGTDGMTLEIDSTEPGLQVYAGAFLPTIPGSDIAPFAGIALEPQGWPDAVNNANFPSILCTKDRPYRQITRYTCAFAT